MDTMDADVFYQDLISGKFVSMVKESVKEQVVECSKDLYNIIKPLTAQNKDIEQFWVIYFNARNCIMKISKLFSGTITEAAVYPREVMKAVLKAEATAVVFCHNHPSGNPKPTKEDYCITFKLITALQSIGVTVHDHVVIGDNGNYYSMADRGDMHRLMYRYKEMVNKKLEFNYN